MRYLRGTQQLYLVLGVHEEGNVKWWIGASYAVHPDMQGHTGATMTMGKGSVFSGAWEHRLVTRSLTESEVVGVYDSLPYILWTQKFIEKQGVTIAKPLYIKII